jgi:RNA polymerase sigma factor (sigma-70 family)
MRAVGDRVTDDAREAGRESARDPAPVSDDERRIAGFLRGDRPAFDELNRWIRETLARRFPGLAREHDDLRQVVHARLLVSLREGRFVGAGGLRPYVAGVVHHVAIDRLREIYRTRTLSESLALEPPSGGADPYLAAEFDDEDRLLHAVLLAAPASCRELWRLLLVERLTYEEIGHRLSVPAGTVKSRMWYCRRKALAVRRRLQLSRHAGSPRARSRREG